MENPYIKKKNEYIKKKHEYLSKIKFCEEEIKKLDNLIIDNCDHEWIKIREPGQYGELYTLCKKCRVDRYAGFIH